LRWEGGWCWSRYKNIRGQEFEESRPRQRRIGKASAEVQGPPRAFEPLMMMMITMCIV
jgi:hypothetical protein